MTECEHQGYRRDRADPDGCNRASENAWWNAFPGLTSPGAAQGIGRAVALHVASPGVHLAVWDVKRDGVEETAKLCQEKGAAARASTVDVGDADAIEAAVSAFERAWGKPDGLVEVSNG